jgi:hypothetical protein
VFEGSEGTMVVDEDVDVAEASRVLGGADAWASVDVVDAVAAWLFVEDMGG